MKITELETIVIQHSGDPRVIEDSIHRIGHGRELVMRLHTESGLYGTYPLSIGGYGGELTRQLFEVGCAVLLSVRTPVCHAGCAAISSIRLSITAPKV